MIDKDHKPYLLEINQSPSFTTDKPLDIRIKKGVLVDCMKILNLSMSRKNKYKQERQQKLNERNQKKPTNIDEATLKKKQKEEKAAQKKNRMLEREKYEKEIIRNLKEEEMKKEENKNLKQMNNDTGGYILIYPLVDYKTEYWI